MRFDIIPFIIYDQNIHSKFLGTNMSIQIRIFMGYICTSEMNMHLNQSAAWKEAKLLFTQQAPTSIISLDCSTVNIPSIKLQLQETEWKEKKYIGSYISSPITYLQIKNIGENLKSLLQNYCPTINLDNRSIHLFSQLFYS